MIIFEHPPQFFTATILEWQKLLKPEKYKSIIINSLQYLVANNRILLLGYVIMDNHIHIIWQIKPPFKRADIQRDFLKFVSQNIKFDLVANHPNVLEMFKVNLKDRAYQFFKRNPLSIDLIKREVLEEKLLYVHSNPVKAGLSQLPEQYKFSSAEFYITGVDRFNFLTHYNS